MTELSRTLLSAAREGLAPDAATMARVRAKVAASVAAAPAAVAATTTTTAAPAKLALLVKLGAIVLAVGVTSAVIVGARGERAAEVPTWSVASTSIGEDEPRASEQVAVADGVAPPPAALTKAPPKVTSVKPPASSTAAAPAPANVGATTSEPEPTKLAPVTLSREVELIDLAMVSLRKGAPRAALEAIRVFERETFGRGQMAEEAAAIEIEAHCRLHEDVTDKLAAFDRKWPSSAQRERIQTTCFGR